MRLDGTLIVSAPDAGYSAIVRFVTAASELVGAYVPVLADDTPGTGIAADAL